MSIEPHQRERIKQYMERARQVLTTGKLAMTHEDYITAVNRAYYAIFYAANALLSTKGLERSKHSDVIAAFRQHFVKTGMIESEFSRFYGTTMDERHVADYDLEPLDYESASRHLNQAEAFVKRIQQALDDMGVWHD